MFVSSNPAPLTRLGLANLPISAAMLLSAAAVHLDADSGPSTATAWGLVYMTVFARSAVKSRTGILYTLGVGLVTAGYANEVLDGYL